MPILATLADAPELADGHFRAVVDVLPAALYTTDADGRITYYNDAAAEMWGRRPSIGEDWWCGSWRLFWLDGTPMRHDECPMAVTLKTGEAVRGAEAIAERPDGSRYFFQPFPTPLFSDSGELIGAVNMLIDITERRRTEEATLRLAAIVASSDDAIISKTLNGIVTSWNEAAERLFGYTPDEIIGQSILKLIPADRQDEETEIVGRIRKGERVEHYETVRRRKDGSLFDISLTVSPIKRQDGTVIGASKIARDISERKIAQDTKELLLHEIKHRVKNTLATVQAMASQTFRGAPVEEREAFVSRLHALAGAHNLLTEQNWDTVDVRSIVGRALRPFTEQDVDRVVIDGPETPLDPGNALLLAMALHELGTNAVKYGALSTLAGRIKVVWTLECGARNVLKLRWQESGGPPVRQPERQGFGSRMIERALKGRQGAVQFDFAPDGLVCLLEVAL
jgi:PAS domain S-box-containing protein